MKEQIVTSDEHVTNLSHTKSKKWKATVLLFGTPLLKMTRYARNVGGMALLPPPATPMTPKLGILTRACWIGTISLATFIEAENSCCVPRFPLILGATKVLTAKLHSCYVEESELVSEILERSEWALKSETLERSDILPLTPQSWQHVQ